MLYSSMYFRPIIGKVSNMIPLTRAAINPNDSNQVSLGKISHISVAVVNMAKNILRANNRTVSLPLRWKVTNTSHSTKKGAGNSRHSKLVMVEEWYVRRFYHPKCLPNSVIK